MTAQSANPVPGFCLTFDDRGIEGWYRAGDIFAKHGALATFFVSQFHELTDRQIGQLRELEKAGHEIGYHATHHLMPTDFLASHTLEEYMDVEIYPALAVMRQLGFKPKSFAYPFNAYTDESNRRLLEMFSILRSAIIRCHDPISFEESLTAQSGNRIVFSSNIDVSTIGATPTIPDVERQLDVVAQSGKVVTYYAHEVSDGPAERSSISLGDLDHLLNAANRRNLHFYRFCDLE
jgi:peptidoglycan/xylan/chitin deacetylase (PgdA/CDA1 family)